MMYSTSQIPIGVSHNYELGHQRAPLVPLKEGVRSAANGLILNQKRYSASHDLVGRVAEEKRPETASEEVEQERLLQLVENLPKQLHISAARFLTPERVKNRDLLIEANAIYQYNLDLLSNGLKTCKNSKEMAKLISHFGRTCEDIDVLYLAQRDKNFKKRQPHEEGKTRLAFISTVKTHLQDGLSPRTSLQNSSDKVSSAALQQRSKGKGTRSFEEKSSMASSVSLINQEVEANSLEDSRKEIQLKRFLKTSVSRLPEQLHISSSKHLFTKNKVVSRDLHVGANGIYKYHLHLLRLGLKKCSDSTEMAKLILQFRKGTCRHIFNNYIKVREELKTQRKGVATGRTLDEFTVNVDQYLNKCLNSYEAAKKGFTSTSSTSSSSVVRKSENEVTSNARRRSSISSYTSVLTNAKARFEATNPSIY